MARKLVVGFAVLALLTAFTVPAFAQGSAESSVRGNLAGTVVDSSGAVVTGAKVTISGPTGTKSDTTNQDGQFGPQDRDSPPAMGWTGPEKSL